LACKNKPKPVTIRGFDGKPEEESPSQEFAILELKNLQSLLNAWHFVNNKLDFSFDSQTKNAMVCYIQIKNRINYTIDIHNYWMRKMPY